MADRRQIAILNAQYKKAISEPHDYLKYMLDEQNVAIWYVLLSGFDGDESEYTNGEYLVRVELPKDFPFNPPQFYFMTKQGLYGVETKVCISIGEYHKADYRAALGVVGFCNQLVSGLIGWRDMGSGINIIKTSPQEKKKLAMASRSANYENHPEIMKKFDTNFIEYSSKWDRTKMTDTMKIRFPEITIQNTNNNSPKSETPAAISPNYAANVTKDVTKDVTKEVTKEVTTESNKSPNKVVNDANDETVN